MPITKFLKTVQIFVAWGQICVCNWRGKKRPEFFSTFKQMLFALNCGTPGSYSLVGLFCKCIPLERSKRKIQRSTKNSVRADQFRNWRGIKNCNWRGLRIWILTVVLKMNILTKMLDRPHNLVLYWLKLIKFVININFF